MRSSTEFNEDRLITLNCDQTDYNKIKNINGRAFASLSKLTLVKLFWNVCINEDFESATRIVEMPRIVEEKCGSKVDDLKVQSE